MLNWLRAKMQTKWSFVLIYGVVGWGGICALLMTLAEFTRSPQDIALAKILQIWIIFPAGGVVFGLMMYWWLQRRLRRRTATDPGRLES